MKIHVLWPFAFGLVLVLTMNSCTKTIVQTNTVFDTLHRTDTLQSMDTLRDTAGLGWIRFVSMFPGATPPTIFISKTPGGSAFSFGTTPVTGTFLPLRPDTSYTFYLSSPNLPGWSSTLDIPPLGSTINTYALFLIISPNGKDSTMHPFWSIDSEKLTPPPAGYCYVRCIDGIPDGDQYKLDLDSVYNDLTDIQNLQITRYVLIKAGEHTVLFRTIGTANTPLQKPGNFQDGAYYTVRANGSFGDHSEQLTIDQE